MSRPDIDDEAQRRHFEALKTKTDAKIQDLDRRAREAKEPAERERLGAEKKAAEENAKSYGAQLRALDRKEPVGALRHERAIVEKELALRDRPPSPQTHRESQETLGEIGATNAIREHPELRDRYRGYHQVSGFERRTTTGVDQVWRNERGDHLIVEAKGGPNARLAKDQMSESWARTRAQSLACSKDPRDRAAGQALLDAYRSPDKKVEGVTIHQKSASTPATLHQPSHSPSPIQDYKTSQTPAPAKSKSKTK